MRALTAANVGRKLFIELDDQNLGGAPVVQSPISERFMLMVRGSPAEAERLAAGMRAGALPASLELVSETRGRLSSASLSAASVPTAAAQRLEQTVIVDDELRRDLLEAASSQPTAAQIGARLAPLETNGVTVGARLNGVRPDGLVARLALKNGDVVLSVNGERREGPEAVAQALRDIADGRADVVMMRGQKETVIHYRRELAGR
jgi:hypothetical protein